MEFPDLPTTHLRGADLAPCCITMKFLPLLLLALLISFPGPSLADPATDSSGVNIVANQSFKTGDQLTDYEKERCKLDVYAPVNAKDYPTIVWFYGGALKGGNKKGVKDMAVSFARAGIGVVAPDYRLSPKVKFPAYIEDAAAAIAWAHQHIAEYGGDPSKLFVSGHSAGGYLTYMVGLDPRYLQAVGMQPGDVRGYIPISGQTMTHYTVREERGIGQFTIIADEAAPVHYTNKTTPPFLALYADHDMAARAEENEYLVAIMKGAGNKSIEGLLIKDRNHGTIAGGLKKEHDPARDAILDFISKLSAH